MPTGRPLSETTEFAVIATTEGWTDRVDELAAVLAERFRLSAFKVGMDLRRGEAEVTSTPTRADADGIVRELRREQVHAFVRAPGRPAEHIPPPIASPRVAGRDVSTDDHPEAGATVIPGWVGSFGSGGPVEPEPVERDFQGTMIGRPGALGPDREPQPGWGDRVTTPPGAAQPDEPDRPDEPNAPAPPSAPQGPVDAGSEPAPVTPAPPPGPWSAALDDLARPDTPSVPPVAAPPRVEVPPPAIEAPAVGAARNAWEQVLGTSLGGRLAEESGLAPTPPPPPAPVAEPPLEPDAGDTIVPSAGAGVTVVHGSGARRQQPPAFDGAALDVVASAPPAPTPSAIPAGEHPAGQQAVGYQRLRPAPLAIEHPPKQAALWSVVAPGAGQAYNHEFGRALTFALTSFLVVPWIASVVDAWRRAAEISEEPPRVAPDTSGAARLAAGFWIAAIIAATSLTLAHRLTLPDQGAIEALGADNDVDIAPPTPVGPESESSALEAQLEAQLDEDRAEAQRLVIEARRSCDTGDYHRCRLLAETALDRDEANADAMRLLVDAVAGLSPGGSGDAPDLETP